jgi:hypothetical protein
VFPFANSEQLAQPQPLPHSLHTCPLWSPPTTFTGLTCQTPHPVALPHLQLHPNSPTVPQPCLPPYHCHLAQPICHHLHVSLMIIMSEHVHLLQGRIFLGLSLQPPLILQQVFLHLLLWAFVLHLILLKVCKFLLIFHLILFNSSLVQILLPLGLHYSSASDGSSSSVTEDCSSNNVCSSFCCTQLSGTVFSCL